MLHLIIYCGMIIIILFLIKKWVRGGICKNKHDMTGQFIIITGASSGLGKISSLDLINHNARVIFACRTESKANEVIKEIPENLRKNAEFIKIDLSSFSSIKSFSDKIKSNYLKIDILMNNAGLHPTTYKITEDNLESFLEGNYIGAFYLTILLLPHMNDKGRIINLSSIGHYLAKIKLGEIKNFTNNEYMKKKFFGGLFPMIDLYGNTKLFMMYFTQYLSFFFEEKYKNLKSVCLHPGIVNTDFFERITRDYPNSKLIYKTFKWGFQFFGKTPIEGAQTQLYLCYAPWEELINGEYYADCKRINPFAIGRNQDIRNEVINWTIDLLKKYFPEDNCVKDLKYYKEIKG